MVRSILLSLAVLLTTQVAPALAQVKNITVTGQLQGGNFINAAVSVGNTGQVSGTGVLYGVNPSNGYTYKYPFTITTLATTSGKLVLYGTIVGANYPVTIVASVPSGPLTFSYIVNGNVVTMSGTGTVTAK